MLPDIVSVQKNPNPRAFKALKNAANVGANVICNVTLLITIVAVPQLKLSLVISQEYFVVALMLN